MGTIEKAITKEELSQHCKCKTRGKELTIHAAATHGTCTNSLGVPVFSEKMTIIWKEEKKHVLCIQDPSTVNLYTMTSYIKNGGVQLPVYRCAHGKIISSPLA